MVKVRRKEIEELKKREKELIQEIDLGKTEHLEELLRITYSFYEYYK